MYNATVHIVIDRADGSTIIARSVEQLHTKRSIHSLLDTASFTLPITSRLRKESGEKLNSEQIAYLFQKGDKVSISLGHDNQLKNEFKGFIKRPPSFTDPVLVECEGYAYQLRRKAPIKSWKSADIKEVLSVLLEGTDISVHPDTPSITLAPFYMGTKNESALDVLDNLKSTKVLHAFFIEGDQLYVGPELIPNADKQVIHKLGYNTFSQNDLKYRTKDEVKIHVSVTYKDDKGKTHHTTAGQKGGLELNYTFGVLSGAEEAKAKALAKAEKHTYEGYEGKITATWIPHCQPGWSDKIIDPKYTERNATVVVETVKCVLDDKGDERILELGKVINKQV